MKNLDYVCWRDLKNSISASELREKSHRKELHIPLCAKLPFPLEKGDGWWREAVCSIFLPLGSLCKGPEYGNTRNKTWKLGGAREFIENKSFIFTEEEAEA